MSSLGRRVAAWGTQSAWGKGRSSLQQSVVCALCLRPFHADWRSLRSFPPRYPIRLFLLPLVGRGHQEPGHGSWDALALPGTGQRARKRDVPLWGRFLRLLDRNVPSRNIHSVAHSSRPDWGNGSRGCFTKGFLNPISCPRGPYTQTELCPLLSAAVAETNVGRVSGWIRSFCLCLMLQVILEVFHRKHISGSGYSRVNFY